MEEIPQKGLDPDSPIARLGKQAVLARTVGPDQAARAVNAGSVEPLETPASPPVETEPQAPPTPASPSIRPLADPPQGIHF